MWAVVRGDGVVGVAGGDGVIGFVRGGEDGVVGQIA